MTDAETLRAAADIVERDQARGRARIAALTLREMADKLDADADE